MQYSHHWLFISCFFNLHIKRSVKIELPKLGFPKQSFVSQNFQHTLITSCINKGGPSWKVNLWLGQKVIYKFLREKKLKCHNGSPLQWLHWAAWGSVCSAVAGRSGTVCRWTHGCSSLPLQWLQPQGSRTLQTPPESRCNHTLPPSETIPHPPTHQTTQKHNNQTAQDYLVEKAVRRDKLAGGEKGHYDHLVHPNDVNGNLAQLKIKS